jgi:murein endopeptidase
MEAWAARQVDECPLTEGMYLKKNTVLRLDSRAVANGQCVDWLLQCSPLPCTCAAGPTYERTINHTTVKATFNTPPDATLGYVYGKDPNTGFTAFYHVLDSRDPITSTGPLDRMMGYAGETALKFQANINTTLCNMSPSTTPLVTINFHVRSAIHRGFVTDGTLDGGSSLPTGTGYPGYDQIRVGDPQNTDDWSGAEDMHKLIKDVGAQWSAPHPTPRIGILDISRQNGGLFSPHDSHQNGLDVDVRYVRNDGTEGALDLSTQFAQYSKPLTVEMLNLFAASGQVTLILVNSVSQISGADVPDATVIQAAGHLDHLHIRIADPDEDDSKSCPKNP